MKIRYLFMLLPLFVLWGCGGFEGSAKKEPVAIDIFQEKAYVAEGLTTQFSAVARFEDNTTEEFTGRVQWKSDTDTPFSLDKNGLVTGLAKGSGTIRAEWNGRTWDTVNVAVRRIVAVELQPPYLQMMAGTDQTAEARLRFENGSFEPIYDELTWRSGDSSVVTVDPEGRITALSTGTAHISATLAGFSDTARVDVHTAALERLTIETPTTPLPTGIHTQFTAKARFCDGREEDVTYLAAWESNDTAATVEAGRCLVTSATTLTLSATYAGHTTSQIVTATPAAPEALYIESALQEMVIGYAHPLYAVAALGDGRYEYLNTPDVTWESDNPSVATVDANGVVRALATGSVLIRATASGISTAHRFSVSGAVFDRIEISPDTLRLTPDTSLALTAQAVFTDGRVLDVTYEGTWETGSPGHASIFADGRLYTHAPGTTEVVFTHQNHRKSVLVAIASDADANVDICAPLAEDSSTVFIASDDDLDDDTRWYDGMRDDILNVAVATRTKSGACVVGDYSGCTLADVNADLDPYDDFKPEIAVHMQADDFPDDGSVSNATLRIRGKSTREADQKSYRIKLDSKTSLWRSERILQLNKHPYDLSHLRNMLSFNLFRGIDHFTSLRTQFVHLFVDNEDYGIYTHVENVGEEYLQNRGFDTRSNLYKPQNYFFTYKSGLALDLYDHPVDPVSFEAAMELQNGDDTAKLLRMTHAVESDFSNFPVAFERYFNRNNYLTWLAVNFLTDNRDIITQNFYLYNPTGSSRFYFLPWDYDGAWGFDQQPKNLGEATPVWQSGIGNLWDSPLHRKFLSEPANIEALKRAVSEVRARYLTDAHIEERVNTLSALLRPHISKQPDIRYLYANADEPADIVAEWETEIADLPNRLKRAETNFYQSIERPMPFWTAARYDGRQIFITWSPSTDLQGDDVSYDLRVAARADFAQESLLIERDGIRSPRCFDAITLAPGTYFIQVTATDAQGHTQEAFDIYTDENGTDYPGVFEFSVK